MCACISISFESDFPAKDYDFIIQKFNRKFRISWTTFKKIDNIWSHFEGEIGPQEIFPPQKNQSISKEVRCSMSMCGQALKQCRRHARAQSQGMYLAVLFAMPWWDAGSSRTQGMLALHAICQFMETDPDCDFFCFFWCCLHIVTARSSCTQVHFFEACSLSSLSRSLWTLRQQVKWARACLA